MIIKNNKEPGKKYDKDKLPIDLLYVDLVNELEDVTKVLQFGAKKYGARNWQNLEGGKERYNAALLRHLAEYNKGVLLDEESGLPHLSHAATCLLFLMYLNNNV